MLIDDFLLVERGRFREAETARAARVGRAIPRAIPSRTSPTCRRRSPPTRRACRSCAAWSRISASTSSHAYMRPRPGQCRGAGAPRARRAEGRRASPMRWTTAPSSASRIAIDRQGAQRRRSTSPAPAPQQPSNFNAPSAVCTRGRALCLPHPGRRRHPDERGLPEAARDRHPRRLDAEPALSGGGGRRQCRDLASASPTRSMARSA